METAVRGQGSGHDRQTLTLDRMQQNIDAVLRDTHIIEMEHTPTAIDLNDLVATVISDVRDNGIGIAPEHQKKVFAMFQRLHAPEDYSGTGLGLTMCRRIALDHGGHISVESTPGIGSRFHVFLGRYMAGDATQSGPIVRTLQEMRAA